MANLTQKQKTEVIPAAIARYFNENNANQVALAQLAGIDKTYVNQIAQGKTHIGSTEIKDKYYKAIARAIGLKIVPEYWQHFNTWNFKQGILALEKAKANKERVGIDGDTGLGKTYLSTVFKRKYAKTVILVKCSGIENSKEFAVNFATACGADTIGTKGKLIKNACTKIRQMDGDMLVIIDEFENSKAGNIPTIKAIADELEGHAGVAVIGIDVQKMLEKTAQRRKQGFIQVNRRWSFAWTKLDGDISDDILQICQALGITVKSAQNWLMSRVHDFDSLKNICTAALEEAEKSGRPVNAELLNELYPM